LASRFKIERRDALLLALFYVAVGLLQLIGFVLSNSTPMPPHIGALAILSLITAYGLFKTKRWSVWLVIMLFFPQLVLSAVSLNAYMRFYALFPHLDVLLLSIALAVFIVLSFASFVYVAAKRKTFQ